MGLRNPGLLGLLYCDFPLLLNDSNQTKVQRTLTRGQLRIGEPQIRVDGASRRGGLLRNLAEACELEAGEAENAVVDLTGPAPNENAFLPTGAVGTSSLEADLATALGLLRGPLGGAVRGFAVAAAGLVVAVDLAATGNLRTACQFLLVFRVRCTKVVQ